MAIALFWYVRQGSSPQPPAASNDKPFGFRFSRTDW